MTQRIEPCVKKRLKEWNSFSKNYSKNWTLLKWLIELNLFFMNLFSIWLKELKSFCSMTPRVQLFLCSNKTQRIENFLQFDSKNCVFFFKWLKGFNSFFWIWLKRVEPFLLNMTQRIQLLEKKAQRIEFFLERLKQIGFLVWLKELNLFFAWPTELNLFFEKYDSKNWTLFMTHRIEPLFMTHRIELLFEYDSKNWISFLSMTQRIELFSKRKRLTELNPSFHSQKWTLLFNMTWRIEPLLFSNMTQRIEFFLID